MQNKDLYRDGLQCALWTNLWSLTRHFNWCYSSKWSVEIAQGTIYPVYSSRLHYLLKRKASRFTWMILFLFFLQIIAYGWNNIMLSLSAEGVQPISWSTRMNIAIDVARGLSFLHSLDANVIYRDLKASNILLDSVLLHMLKYLILRQMLD